MSIPVWPDFGIKWVRLAQTDINPGLFQIKFQSEIPQPFTIADGVLFCDCRRSENNDLKTTKSHSPLL